MVNRKNQTRIETKERRGLIRRMCIEYNKEMMSQPEDQKNQPEAMGKVLDNVLDLIIDWKNK